MRIYLLIFFFVFSLNIFFFPACALNARAINSIELEIVKSGSLYFENVNEAELSLHIPQEGIQSIEVFPNSWKFSNDSLGNKMIKFFWKNPSFYEKYEIKIKLKNFAKFFENLQEEKWEFSELARKETDLTKANEEMKKLAYGKESIIDKVTRLNIWINENINYEFEKEGKTKSAEETFLLKKGACGEFSNLLISFLRSQEIPSRFVAGYVFGEKDFQPHSWVEVLINGKWVPFDPTWLEGFYLDATHVKFANLLDSNFSEEITYKGFGKVEWKSNPTSFKIINYTEALPKIEIQTEERVKAGSNFLVNVSLKGNCQFSILSLKSCVDRKNNPIFEIKDGTRKFWFCGEQNVYFIASVPEEKTGYICPLTAFDQSGASKKKDVSIAGKEIFQDLLLAGPETVETNEIFKIRADRIGLFFSPNFTESNYSQNFSLSLAKPGKYKIYFYSQGQKGEKIVEAVSKKDFEILEIEKPEDLIEGERFLLNITIKNLLPQANNAKIKIIFVDQNLSLDLNFSKNEEKKLGFELLASKAGIQKIYIQIEGNEFLSYSDFVEIKKKPSLQFIQKIFNFFQLIFEEIKRFLRI
jgi:hypothetical protein